MWDDLTIGYLAGLIDGEGTVRMGKRRQDVSVDVCSTDDDIVLRAFEMSRIGKIYGPYNPPSQAGHKAKFFWKVQKKQDIARLLLAIYPLVSKRRQMKFDEVLGRWGK